MELYSCQPFRSSFWMSEVNIIILPKKKQIDVCDLRLNNKDFMKSLIINIMIYPVPFLQKYTIVCECF